jgi:hypothetical protein
MPALFDRFCERRHAESPEQQRVFLDGGQFEMLGEPPHIDIALATAAAEAVGSELGYLETVCSEPPQDAGALTFRRAAETRLALAMLTHHRLGEHSCVTAIADLVELVGRRVVGEPLHFTDSTAGVDISEPTIARHVAGHNNAWSHVAICRRYQMLRGRHSARFKFVGGRGALVGVRRPKSINLVRLSQLLCDFAPFRLLHYSKSLPLLSLTGTSLAFCALLARAATQH